MDVRGAISELDIKGATSQAMHAHSHAKILIKLGQFFQVPSEDTLSFYIILYLGHPFIVHVHNV